MNSIDFWHENTPPQQPSILSHPFPPQPQEMVTINLSPPQRGMVCTPHHEGYSSNDFVFICDHKDKLHMQAKNYDILEPSHATLEVTSSSKPDGPLHIENPYFDTMLHPSKGILQCMTHNPNTRADHNYSIMEYLA
jgi:hypothetical protein